MTATADEIASTSLWTLAREFLVRCPSCDAMARVRPDPEDRLRRARFSCLACGRGRHWRPPQRTVTLASAARLGVTPGQLTIGLPIDWYFHLPLWLQTPCCGETLWAYNARHLAWLRSYVEAGQRGSTRNHRTGWTNASLASRLPRWIQLAKHRGAVLRALAKLEAQLEA